MKLPLHFRIALLIVRIIVFVIFMPLRIMTFVLSIFQKTDTRPTGPNLKLYRRGANGIEYWETWTDKNRDHIIHWGQLGEKGEDRQVPGAERQSVLDEISERQADGFAPIPDDDLHGLEVVFSIDNWGNKSNVIQRHAMEEHLQNTLGWTGLGHVDGGSIGSGEMEIFAYVVDPDIARRVVTDALDSPDWPDIARINTQAPYCQWSDEDKGLSDSQA